MDLTNQNTVTLVIAIVGAVGTFLTVLCTSATAIILARIASQQKKDAVKVEEVKVIAAATRAEQSTHAEKHVGELAKLAHEMNGMKDELVKVTGEAKFAEGVKAAKDEAIAEKKEGGS